MGVSDTIETTCRRFFRRSKKWFKRLQDSRFGNPHRSKSSRFFELLKSFLRQGHPKVSFRVNTVLIFRQPDLKFLSESNYLQSPLDVDFQLHNALVFPAIVWDIF